MKHDGRTLFEGLPQPCEVGRYHSLIAAPASACRTELEVSAITAEGEIMGVRHRKYTIEGVQFHPESVLTPQGPQLMGNFLQPGVAAARDVAGISRTWPPTLHSCANGSMRVLERQRAVHG